MSEEARRQYLEYLMKEPLDPESVKNIFKPIRPDSNE